MKKLIPKDKKTRVLINKLEINRFLLKTIVKNQNLSQLVRWNIVSNFFELTKYSSKITTIKRCILTGTKKRFDKLYNYSRMVFLKLIRIGSLNGSQKSTW